MIRPIWLDAQRHLARDRCRPLRLGQLDVDAIANQRGENDEEDQQQEDQVGHGRHVAPYTDFISLAQVHAAGSSKMSMNSMVVASILWMTLETLLTKLL